MKFTTNYNLKKPDAKTDLVNIDDLNFNMDQIDLELNKKTEIVITDSSPTERKANTIYCIITKTQGNVGNSDIKVGQSLSAKII